MAATTVGGLIVNLVARTKNFTRNMRGAKREVKGLTVATARARKVLGTFGSSFVGFASVGGFVSLINNAARSTDELGKMSSRLGIAVEDLSRLQFVAEQTGVEFNQLAIGVQRMMRRIAEASIGTGEAVGALQELGLNASELVKLSGDKQFRAVAKALSTVKREADKVRLVFKLFDSEGVGLKNTLALSVEQFDKLIARADRLGTITMEDALAAARFRDEISAIGRVMQKALIGPLKRISELLVPISKTIEFINNSTFLREGPIGFIGQKFSENTGISLPGTDDALLTEAKKHTSIFTLWANRGVPLKFED